MQKHVKMDKVSIEYHYAGRREEIRVYHDSVLLGSIIPTRENGRISLESEVDINSGYISEGHFSEIVIDSIFQEFHQMPYSALATDGYALLALVDRIGNCSAAIQYSGNLIDARHRFLHRVPVDVKNYGNR